MRLILASIALLALPSMASAQLDVIQTAYNPATGHTYSLLEPSSWTEAELAAVAMGGHLVTINDAAENTWVWDTFNFLGTGNLWIGLNDINQEGTFEWSSGEPFGFQYWHWSEPNDLNGAEDYGCMWGWYGGNWNDFNDIPVGWGDWYGVVETEGLFAHPPSPGVAGVPNVLSISNGDFLNFATFVGSLSLSAGLAVPGCPGVISELGNPVFILGSSQIDLFGDASLTVNVPTSMAGRTAYIQVVDSAACVISNLVTVTFS